MKKKHFGRFLFFPFLPAGSHQSAICTLACRRWTFWVVRATSFVCTERLCAPFGKSAMSARRGIWPFTRARRREKNGERKTCTRPVRDPRIADFLCRSSKSRLPRTNEPPKDSRQQKMCARKEKKRVVHENFLSPFSRARGQHFALSICKLFFFFLLGGGMGRALSKRNPKNEPPGSLLHEARSWALSLCGGRRHAVLLPLCFFFEKRRKRRAGHANTQGKIMTEQTRPTGFGLTLFFFVREYGHRVTTTREAAPLRKKPKEKR